MLQKSSGYCRYQNNDNLNHHLEYCFKSKKVLACSFQAYWPSDAYTNITSDFIFKFSIDDSFSFIVWDNVTPALLFLDKKACSTYLKEVWFNRSTQKEIIEHLPLQNSIKNLVESKGFNAVIEEPINNGESRVDVSLTLNNIKIAIEVTVTNKINYEIGNILKSINAGYTTVIMCSNNLKKIEDIKELVKQTIESKMISKVLFYTPTQLFEYLDSITVSKNPNPEKKIKGYRVKVTYK